MILGDFFSLKFFEKFEYVRYKLFVMVSGAGRILGPFIRLLPMASLRHSWSSAGGLLIGLTTAKSVKLSYYQPRGRWPRVGDMTVSHLKIFLLRITNILTRT